jgi:hypothetical protein
MLSQACPSGRTAPLVGRDAHKALLSASIFAPLQAPQLLKKNRCSAMTAPRPRSVVPPVRLPLHHHVWPRPALLRAMPLSTSPIAEGEAGAVCACPPHSARPSAGRGGLRATPRVYAGPLLSTSPGPELAGTGVCHHVGCAHRRCCVSSVSTVFRLMFQVFHLNVASRSWMLDMLQAYVSSV